MGATNTTFYTDTQNRLAILFKAMAHPARIAILEYLLKVDKCICGDIVNELPLAQPTISQHLKELKNAGIIKGNVEGTAICYCVDNEAIEILSAYFSEIILKSNKPNCC